MSDIRFDGRVALVTGAGGGLGRSHALALAARGAKVVVNDLGGAVDGGGGGSAAAQAVAAEIRAAGGEAIANGASVTNDSGVAQMLTQTLDAYGRLDILVANAGILRDKSFAKMTMADFDAVMNVHVTGSVKPIKAAWETMREQNYGRIVVTTSTTGLFGNFGQANYGTAKLALVGLMNTLKLEGAKNNIKINTIAPVAATRMTQDIFSAEMNATFQPEFVTQGVLFLCSDDAPTGAILCAGGGVYATAQMFESDGVMLGGNSSPEAIRDSWEKISDRKGQVAYGNGIEQLGRFQTKMSD
jgi:NAD(P)-dependent dehydrogenase (short-subunit alcohol dehydrogenase family)